MFMSTIPEILAEDDRHKQTDNLKLVLLVQAEEIENHGASLTSMPFPLPLYMYEEMLRMRSVFQGAEERRSKSS